MTIKATNRTSGRCLFLTLNQRDRVLAVALLGYKKESDEALKRLIATARELPERVSMARELDYLDHLIGDAIETRPGFAERWEPDAHMLRLSEERLRLGLTQADEAARMGIGRTAVVRMENDPSGVAFGRILAYARALGVELVMRPSKQKPTPKRRKAVAA